MVWQKSKKVSYHKQIERQQDRATMNVGQDEAWATATLLEVSSHIVCCLSCCVVHVQVPKCWGTLGALIWGVADLLETRSSPSNSVSLGQTVCASVVSPNAAWPPPLKTGGICLTHGNHPAPHVLPSQIWSTKVKRSGGSSGHEHFGDAEPRPLRMGV